MSLPHPSPIERHILDFLHRIDRAQAERIAALENRVQALEEQNSELRQRSGEIEAELRAQGAGITDLADSLAAYLAPPASPRA